MMFLISGPSNSSNLYPLVVKTRAELFLNIHVNDKCKRK